MKITESKLRKIIQEELAIVLEAPPGGPLSIEKGAGFLARAKKAAADWEKKPEKLAPLPPPAPVKARVYPKGHPGNVWNMLEKFHSLKVMRPWKKGPETYFDLANIFEDLFRVAQTTWTQDFVRGYGPGVDDSCFQQVFEAKAGGKKLKRLENLCALLPEKRERVVKKTILKNVRTWIPLITRYVRQHGKGWDDPAIVSVYHTCKKIAERSCKTREASVGL